MLLTLENKKINALLKRVEVSGKISFEGTTPSNVQLAEALTKEMKKETDSVVIKNIYTTFGRQEAGFNALVYDTLEAKKFTEVLTPQVKKKLAEEKKKAASEVKKEGAQ